jgi:hypothetical protein
MRRTDDPSGTIWARSGLVNVVAVVVCVVIVLTGSRPFAAAIVFAATLWAALQHWPTAADGRWPPVQAILTLALLAGAAVAAALAAGFVAAGLVIVAALTAPTVWIRTFSRGTVRR